MLDDNDQRRASYQHALDERWSLLTAMFWVCCTIR